MGGRHRRLAAVPAVILVDTAVWADFFNGRPSAHAERLRHGLRVGEPIAVAPIVVTEVLQGFRSEGDVEKARGLLLRRRLVRLDMQGYVAAASIYRNLRRKGITLRGTVDCIIAQSSIQSGAPLLSPDGDFRRIALHFPLVLESVG